MKIFLTSVFSLILVSSSFSQGGGFEEPLLPEFNVDKFISKVSGRFNDPLFPVSGYQFVLSKNGNLYYQESGGFAIHPNDPGPTIPYEDDTRQNVSSVSKFLCTLVLANVMEEYGVDWDEPVSEYLPITWRDQMAPEHKDSDSPCYLTIERLVRHQSCLDFNSNNGSGGYFTNDQMATQLSSSQINTNMNQSNNSFDYDDYRNGNFQLARIVLVNIWAEATGLINLDIPMFSLIPEQLSAQYYLDLLDDYIYSPLGINAPKTIADLDDFHNNTATTPWAYQYPLITNLNDCSGNLGWNSGVGSLPNNMGGSAMVLTSTEMAEILAFFVHDNTGTIISASQRDKIMSDSLGLAAAEAQAGLSDYGWVYMKRGARGPNCNNRGTRSAIMIFPNGYELSVLTNCRFNQLDEIAVDDFEDSWVTAECNTFTHVTGNGTITQNRSKIDNAGLNFEPDKLLFITHDFTSSGQFSVSPLAVTYQDDHWWIYNEDVSNMASGQHFNVLAFKDEYPNAIKHTHVPDPTGSAPHISVIDHPRLNGKADVDLIVTQDFGGPNGVLNNHSIGVWYNGEKWTVFNQDLSPMVAGAKFNVLFDHVYTDRVSVNNPVGQFFDISGLFFNPQIPSQLLYVTNNLYPEGQFNDSELGVWNLDNDWSVFNQNGNFFIPGAKVNVLKMEDCECCGENPGNISNIEFDWCTNNPTPSCEMAWPVDTIPCAEDYLIYNPIVFDQCEVIDYAVGNPIVDPRVPGLQTYTEIDVPYDIDYYGLGTGRNSTSVVLDTLPPELVGVPDDMITFCTIPPVPEVIGVTDNCTEEIIPEFTETLEGSDCDFKVTRTFTAVDSAGNSVSQTYCIYSGSFADADGDGSDVLTDCDDDDPTVFPGANELCDEQDNNCNDEIDEDCGSCFAPFPAVDESSLSTELLITSAKANWDPVPNQIGCQIQARLAGGALLGQQIIGGANAATFNIPFNLLLPGTDYEWRVRCGCSQAPLIAGPFSSWQPFTTPGGGIIESNPNPTEGLSTVSFKLSEEDFATLEVIDIEGRKVKELFSGLATADNEFRFQFDGSELPNGVYLYRLTTTTEVLTEKFLIAK
ncbi:MAG: serine hydrolase [Bacteroidota bacterium]